MVPFAGAFSSGNTFPCSPFFNVGDARAPAVPRVHQQGYWAPEAWKAPAAWKAAV